MTRISRKVCIIGDFAVGKTSTVTRFVNNVFSEKYLTTVGVKIDTKDLELVDGRSLRMVIWDIAGSDRFSSAEFAYMRGAQGYLLVVDGTRKETLASALALRAAVEERYGALPFVLLLNKYDLVDEWSVSDAEIEALNKQGVLVLCTSAMTGKCVEKAFRDLAKSLTGVSAA
ncbi:MAG: GTP-binding protein [Gammaproteobacteria bacterium]|nr:GTP-binding protein [Gammaproteobacteria bacterium]